METMHVIGLIVGLNVLCAISCHAAPLADVKNGWEPNVISPLVTMTCSTNGRCWGWLPVQELHDESFVPSDDITEPRFQTRRHVSDIEPDIWEDRDSTLPRVRPSVPTTRQLSSRISKKDVFMSRGLGAGGMPFSVLYMSPHGPRPNHPNSNHPEASQQEHARTVENPTTPLEHPNYRIALRNGASNGPSRRQYSIIPQLFISYGWGPFGK